MKSAVLLFLIAAVFCASTEAEIDVINTNAEWFNNNPTETTLAKISDEITEIRLTMDRLSKSLNTHRRAMVQKPPGECSPLPLMQANNSSMYFFCDTQLNWHMAEKYCRNLGMHLAAVDNEMIFSSFVRHFIDFVYQRGITMIGLWIDGTDNGDEGNFYWQSNGQPLRWQKWHDKNPDNIGGNEGCLEIRKFSEDHRGFNPSIPYAFNDANCNDKNRFICEFD